MAKLEMFKGDGGGGSGGGRGGGGQGEAVASLMKKYQDLKEEYRLYRKKAMHAIQVIANCRSLYYLLCCAVKQATCLQERWEPRGCSEIWRTYLVDDIAFVAPRRAWWCSCWFRHARFCLSPLEADIKALDQSACS